MTCLDEIINWKAYGFLRGIYAHAQSHRLSKSRRVLRHFVSLVNRCVLWVCALVNAHAVKCDCPVNVLCSVISAHAVLDGHTLFNYGSRPSTTRRKVRLGCKLAVRVWLVKFLFPSKTEVVSEETAVCKSDISKELAAQHQVAGP